MTNEITNVVIFYRLGADSGQVDKFNRKSFWITKQDQGRRTIKQNQAYLHFGTWVDSATVSRPDEFTTVLHCFM